jgi:hypothetical protein
MLAIAIADTAVVEDAVRDGSLSQGGERNTFQVLETHRLEHPDQAEQQDARSLSQSRQPLVEPARPGHDEREGGDRNGDPLSR